MKILIIGAGRMGVRHLQGALNVKKIEKVILLDINPTALKLAQNTVNNDPHLYTCLSKDFKAELCDICIIASTANNRKELIDIAFSCGCKYLMIEKPLGQSYSEVEELINYVRNLHMIAVVNHNMRLWEPIIKLKHDLATFPQMRGDKTFTINTGTLGIGCNGIHILDLMFYLFDADNARIVAAEIDERIIPNGRGIGFCDFGGWAVIKFYKRDVFVGKLMISMAANSTAYGGWEIIAPFARIVIDEIAETRRTLLRKSDSVMPLYRYAADFEEQPVEKFIAPFLGDLTTLWIDKVTEGVNLLPDMEESLKVHKLMFEWLSYSKTHNKIYPIT